MIILAVICTVRYWQQLARFGNCKSKNGFMLRSGLVLVLESCLPSETGLVSHPMWAYAQKHAQKWAVYNTVVE